MNGSLDNFLFSDTNSLDESYHNLHQIFDSLIIRLIFEALLLNVTLVTTPLMSNFASDEKIPQNYMIEQIVNGSAEISSSTFILSSESENLVSYSFGIGTIRPQLYYKARSLRENYNIYLIPFSSKLWACLMGITFLLVLILTFILSREAKLPHEIAYDVLARTIDVQQDRDIEFSQVDVFSLQLILLLLNQSAQDIQSTPKELLFQKEKWEIGEILLTCLGAACQQGSARDPSTSAARILILCLFILALVGYTAYSASVISLVSLFPSAENELIRDMNYFSNQYKTVLYSMNKVIDLQLNFTEMRFSNFKKGFDKTLQGESVLVGDHDISLTFLHQQNYSPNFRCQLGKTFLGMEYHRVLAVKKNSKFKEKINFIILRLKQYGLLNRERKIIFNVQSPCPLKEKLSVSSFVSFSNKDVKPVINLFTMGVLTSLFLLVAENIIFLCPKEIKQYLSKATGKICNQPNFKQQKN